MRRLRRLRFRLPPIVFAALALALAAPAAAAPGDPVRIAGVDTSGYPEVRVTVVAPEGAPRPGLVENGTGVTGFEATNLAQAKSVVLAVDRSRSMEGQPLLDAVAAARAFVAAGNATDRVEVVAFGSSAVPLTSLSASAADVDAALADLRTDPRQGTALWDAIVLASGHLEAEEEQARVIVVLTDGDDVSSDAALAEAIAAAQGARATVYAIGIAGRGFSPEPLRRLAARTGGTYQQVSSSAELAALYQRLSSELSRTWELRYQTAARPGEGLTLQARIAGAGQAQTTVSLPTDAGLAGIGPDPTLLPASVWRSPLAPFVVSLAVGFLVLLACGFWFSARAGTWLRARLDPHLGTTKRGAGRKRQRRGTRNALQGVLAATEHAFANVKQFRSLQRLLVRADLPLRAAELLYICLGAGFLGGLLALALGAPMLIILLLFVLGASLPVLFVRFKAGARVRAFDNQLPDLLIAIAASLKAGHSFRQALQSVVDEGAEPASKDFTRVLAETRLGRPMDDALAEMTHRVGSRNLSFVVTAVTIQRQIGGSLAGLFDMVAETVRQRHQFARKIRGLTAMGRMSAYVLTGLPLFLALAITVLNPAYMAPLYTTPTGQKLIALGLMMIAVGTVILKKIVSFKG